MILTQDEEKKQAKGFEYAEKKLELKKTFPSGYTKLDNNIFYDPAQFDFTTSELVVYAVFKMFTGDGGDCYPSYGRIAKCARVSRLTAIRAVKSLIKKDYLTILTRGGTVYKKKAIKWISGATTANKEEKRDTWKANVVSRKSNEYFIMPVYDVPDWKAEALQSGTCTHRYELLIRFPDGYTKIDNRILLDRDEEYDFSSAELAVYLALVTHAGNNNKIFPKYSKLAIETRMTRMNVIRVIESLTLKGYIKYTIKTHKNRRGQKTNDYSILRIKKQ